LFQCVEGNSDNNDKSRSADERSSLIWHAEGGLEYQRNDGNGAEENRAGRSNARENVINVFSCGLARSFPRDKSTGLFQVVCNVIWVKHDCGVKVTEKGSKKCVANDIKVAALKEIKDPALL